MGKTISDRAGMTICSVRNHVHAKESCLLHAVQYLLDEQFSEFQFLIDENTAGLIGLDTMVNILISCVIIFRRIIKSSYE